MGIEFMHIAATTTYNHRPLHLPDHHHWLCQTALPNHHPLHHILNYSMISSPLVQQEGKSGLEAIVARVSSHG